MFHEKHIGYDDFWPQISVNKGEISGKFDQSPLLVPSIIHEIHNKSIIIPRTEATHAFWGGLQGWFPEGLEVIHVGEPEPEPQGNLDRNKSFVLKEGIKTKTLHTSYIHM